MGLLDPILSKLPGKLGRNAKTKARSAAKKAANQGISKTFE